MAAIRAGIDPASVVLQAARDIGSKGVLGLMAGILLLGAACAVRIVYKDKVVGVLAVFWERPSRTLSERIEPIFLLANQAGAAIESPGCGPCMGNHMGIPAEGEVTISTANRNFRGRMGTQNSEVYLANPAVVAASAVAGQIVHPSDL